MSAVLVLAGATALGSLIAGRPADRDPDLPITYLLTTAVGLAVLVMGGNILSHFKVNGPALYIAMLLLPIAANPLAWAPLVASARDWLTQGNARSQHWLGPLVLLVVVAIHAGHAALPEMYWDALAMHLYVPTYIATFGKWSYDAQRYAWAVFPLGADWLFTYAFVVGGEMAAKLLNFALGGATTVLLYLQLRRTVPVSWASLLTAACMSAPIMVLLSTSLLVENTLMFLMLAGLLLVDRLDGRWRSWLALWTVVAALCSIKLHGAIFATALTLVALWRALRGQARPPALAWVLSVPLVMLALQPYVTAYWITGNPLFPFYNAIFKSPFFPSQQNFVDPRWARGWGLDSVWGMTFQSSRFLETASPGTLGYLVVTLGPLALAAMLIRRTPATTRAALVALFFLAVVGSSVQYVRYFSPILPILTVAAVGLVALSGHLVGRLVQATLLGVIVLNCVSIPSGGWLLKGFHPVRLLAPDGRAQLLRDLVPQRPLNALVTEMEHSPVTVIYLGAPVGAGLAGQAIYGAWYNSSFADALNRATTEEQVAGAIVATGARYVIANFAEGVPQQNLVAGALKARATLVRRVGWAELFLLDRELRLTRELLTNPGFDSGAEGWAAAPKTPDVTDGVVLLQPGALIAQTIPAAGAATQVEGEVTLICLSDETLLAIRLESSRANGPFSAISTERAVCGGVPRLVVQISGDVPDSAAALQVVVSSIRGGVVGVDRVSVRTATK